jgi:hypothetical protein
LAPEKSISAGISSSMGVGCAFIFMVVTLVKSF